MTTQNENAYSEANFAYREAHHLYKRAFASHQQTTMRYRRREISDKEFLASRESLNTARHNLDEAEIVLVRTKTDKNKL